MPGTGVDSSLIFSRPPLAISNPSLSDFAAGAEVGQDGFDAVLVDDAGRRWRRAGG